VRGTTSERFLSPAASLFSTLADRKERREKVRNDPFASCTNKDERRERAQGEGHRRTANPVILSSSKLGGEEGQLLVHASACREEAEE